jgi:hypothetical protein
MEYQFDLERRIDKKNESSARSMHGIYLQDNRVIQQKNNTGLPDKLKTGVENLSGLSMNDVKVHFNSPMPAWLNALAYAQGTDIHIATGQEKYLPHEAWHVVQQKQGRVKPTMQLKQKVAVNDDKRLEQEADMKGNEAASQRPTANSRIAGPSITHHEESVLQRRIISGDKQADKTPVIKSALQEISKTEVFTFVDSAKELILIVIDGSSSSAMMKTKLNAEEIERKAAPFSSQYKEVNILIPIRDEDLAGILGPRTMVRADGRTTHQVNTYEDTGLVPIFDITGRYETIKRAVPMMEPLLPTKISFATILLHELAHARQYIIGRNAAGMQKGSKPASRFPFIDLPILNDIESLLNDIRMSQLASPHWTARVLELAELGNVFHITEDILKDKGEKYRELAASIKELNRHRLFVLDITKLWMEHDVMINVEHGFAAGRGEGIRLRHGEESDVSIREIVDVSGKDDIRHVPKNIVLDKSNLHAGNAADEMKAQLKKDSIELPVKLRLLLDGMSRLADRPDFPVLSEDIHDR